VSGGVGRTKTVHNISWHVVDSCVFHGVVIFLLIVDVEWYFEGCSTI